jgi:hypothetical protein
MSGKRAAIAFALAGFSLVLATFVSAWLMSATPAGAAGQIAYVPVDPRVFVSRNTVARWAANHNENAVDRHAIVLFDGITARTNQTFRGVQLAVYDTWFTPCDIYPATPRCGRGIIHQPAILDLEPPQQFFHTPRVTDADIFSGVRYNAEMKDFVDQGYGGAPYTTGAGLVNAIGAGQKDLVDTALPSAMVLKPTYQLLSRTQPTVIGYWQGPGLTVQLGATTSPLVPDSTTWLKVALIDPTGKATNTKPVTFCANTIDPTGAIVSSRSFTAPPGSYKVIPLSDFYAIPMTPAEVGLALANRAELQARQRSALVARYGARAAAANPGCPDVVPRDPAAALVGMHVVTAELLDVWTWQTFWWNPNVKPLPGTHGPFSHFDYATAYWTIDKPPFGYRVAFNPYLETDQGTATYLQSYWRPLGKPGSVINLGRTSNCISCHQIATYTIDPKASPGPGYVSHGNEPQLTLPNAIMTRNLWSLAIRAGHPKP